MVGKISHFRARSLCEAYTEQNTRRATYANRRHCSIYIGVIHREDASVEYIVSAVYRLGLRALQMHCCAITLLLAPGECLSPSLLSGYIINCSPFDDSSTSTQGVGCKHFPAQRYAIRCRRYKHMDMGTSVVFVSVEDNKRSFNQI